MTTMDDMMATNEMLAVGTVPIHPGVMDYKDANGKIVLFVREQEEGRSLFMSIEMYGELSRTYEVRYEDWEPVILKMAVDLTAHDLTHNTEGN